MWTHFKRWLRHAWLDEADARRVVPPAMRQRLAARVAASEARHTGQVRLCVEASLPVSYLWRHLWHRQSLPHVVRSRALMMFSKLRIWDTEGNNGVLIYLLLAERAIEIVADRALARQVPQPEWDAMLARLSGALHADRFEDGLTQALGEVSALLVAHFPRVPDDVLPPGNELADEPVVQ
ncbi:MAG: hypothetical protein ABS45_10615 [Comamonas sp. SCN 65-56]|uniref:TPM domain-containing protein n=1 Tax=Comamonas sp. SCN 65-56 TaxID=1660095 RepID=UPI00086B0C9A|nr:TPM domain-containing protein [Comamonas sp. SCN 65-56]ODS91544.1 MAG: hypothetical protein ABS45_10615 [Comamonas sp. SCN 65-56]